MYVALHEVTWCMVVWCTQNLRRDGCSFMWHQPCQRCKYTTSVDIQKRAIKKKASHSCSTICERSESAQESGEQRYISDHQSINQSINSLFFLLACPFVSRVISFIYDVRVRGVVSMFNEPLILSLCGVVRERLLPCRVVVG